MPDRGNPSCFELLDELGKLLTEALKRLARFDNPAIDDLIEAKDLVNKLKARLADVR